MVIFKRLIIAMLLLIVAYTVFIKRDTPVYEDIIKLAKEKLDNNELLILSEATRFEWDTVYFLRSMLASEIAFTINASWNQHIDYGYLLLFKKGDRVVYYELIYPKSIGSMFSTWLYIPYPDIDYIDGYSISNAIFKVNKTGFDSYSLAPPLGEDVPKTETGASVPKDH